MLCSLPESITVLMNYMKLLTLFLISLGVFMFGCSSKSDKEVVFEYMDLVIHTPEQLSSQNAKELARRINNMSFDKLVDCIYEYYHDAGKQAAILRKVRESGASNSQLDELQRKMETITKDKIARVLRNGGVGEKFLSKLPSGISLLLA